MKIQSTRHLGGVLDACKWGFFACIAGLLFTGTAFAHGGGLDADGCHTNRKTGEYHCHRGGGRASTGTVPTPSTVGVRSANSFVSTRSAPSAQTCYTGPRGGTYTITASGRKNYGGC
ncbi:YHYH domain-containing protein [Cupriavidus sp. D384]|uniref:YHYH domain-containing protein n=1 Tax=Cupriavidus sp. D384 TaxID=1538095 RepID=UPI0012E7D052|nr:YHYH domain-containing protein [Cupriavidus sp. D384]